MSIEALALPRRVVMPNGVPLYLLDSVDKGVVRFDLLFKGGYAVQHKPLQAMFTNRMLREGAGTLTAAEISRRLDYYGAWIDIYSSQNCNHITLYTMSKHFVPLLQVLEEMVKYPLFPQENLDVVRSSNKSYFSVNSQKVDVVSQRYFENSLWGEEHALGHVVEAADYVPTSLTITMPFMAAATAPSSLPALSMKQVLRQLPTVSVTACGGVRTLVVRRLWRRHPLCPVAAQYPWMAPCRVL